MRRSSLFCAAMRFCGGGSRTISVCHCPMCAGGLPACLAATPVALGGELRQSDPEDDLAVILGKGAFE